MAEKQDDEYSEDVERVAFGNPVEEAEQAAADAEAALDAATGRGRRKKAEPAPAAAKPQQADMADIVIEDPLLETYLSEVYENADAAATYRAANKSAKTRMLEEHGSAVNSDDDGTHSGYVRVGGFRFKPRYGTHEESESLTTRHAGKDWAPLEIERIV